MSLVQQINTDFLAAMKAKEKATLSTLRMLKSALKNKEIETQHELSDEEAMGVVKSQIKQLKDAMETYQSAGRTEMVEETRAELAILDAYLPPQMSEEELERVVTSALTEAGVSDKADMGRAMGIAMKAVQGQADGSRVRQIVQSFLGVWMLVVLASLIPGTAQAAGLFGVEFQAEVYIEWALRLFRVMIVVLGIVSVNQLLRGGFTYMVSSGRNDSHKFSMRLMADGVLGTILVAILFTIATILLQQL